MDAHDLDQLDDESYEYLVKNNCHRPSRDPEAWTALTQPDTIQRTQDTIHTMLERTASALRKRKAERDAFQQECFTRGEAGKREWFASRTEYEQWRRRAGNFHQTMQQALADLGRVRKTLNRGINHSIAQNHRDTLRLLSMAVSRHQAAHARAGGIAEQHDYELWQLLDRLTVPIGPDNEPTALRTMLDIYWTDVRPVTDGQREAEDAERQMRSAPAGQSARFAGVPKARHVDNGKHLA